MNPFVKFLGDFFFYSFIYLSGIGIAIAVILIWIRSLTEDK